MGKGVDLHIEHSARTVRQRSKTFVQFTFAQSKLQQKEQCILKNVTIVFHFFLQPISLPAAVGRLGPPWGLGLVQAIVGLALP